MFEIVIRFVPAGAEVDLWYYFTLSCAEYKIK